MGRLPQTLGLGTYSSVGVATMNTNPPDPSLSADNVAVTMKMPTKDRLALILSVLSLTVSIGTLILNRVDVSKAEANRSDVAAYQAYELGDGLGRTFVGYSMTTTGDKQAIDQLKQQLAGHARQTVQPIADRLDLRVDIAAKLAVYDSNDVLGARAIEDLRRDVEAVHGTKVARKMMLGYQLFYLYANTSAVSKDHPQDKPKLAEIYRPRAKAINEELASMGISHRLPNELETFEVTLTSLKSVASAVHLKLAANRG